MKLFIGAVALGTPQFADVAEAARPFFDEVVLNPYGRKLREEEIAELWTGADAVVAGSEAYPASLLSRAPEQLTVISRHGVGYDAVDLQAARARGIKVCNTPGANAGAVADLAVGLMLSLLRKIPQQDRLIRSGKWTRIVGNDMAGKTIGILGMGAIGKNVIRRCSGFGARFLAYDPYFDTAFAAEYHVEQADAEAVLRHSDILSLHLPNTPETFHFINEKTLSLMKPTALLINTARGDLVDEDALCDALAAGGLGGAGLDVFHREPLTESRLFQFDNVVLSPHQAGNSVETTAAMGRQAIQNAIQVLQTGDCPSVVNR